MSSFSPLKFCSEFRRPFSSPRWICRSMNSIAYEEDWRQNMTSNFDFIQNQNRGEKTVFSSTLSKMRSIEKYKLLRHSWEVHSVVKEDNVVFRSVGLNPVNLKECCLNWSSSKEICSVASPKWRPAGLSDFLVDTHLQTKK